MKSIKQIFLAIILFSLPAVSMAWGVLGHRIVGQIADSYLTAKAKVEIQKILGNESIAMSSNWPDFIKSDTSFNYLSPWHYINLDQGLTHEQVLSYLQSDTATDVYTKINFIVKALKNKALPVDQKRFYLRLLIHMVGDVHQPMHTGHKDDLGGNRVKVNWFSTPTNLHAVWDESLVNFQQLSYTEYAAAINHTTLLQRKQWQAQPLSQWVLESYEIANKLYPEITEKDQRLSYDYNFRHLATVNEQLLKGGVRLAGLLNSIFG